jgi:hypothetical protein
VQIYLMRVVEAIHLKYANIYTFNITEREREMRESFVKKKL